MTPSVPETVVVTNTPRPGETPEQIAARNRHWDAAVDKLRKEGPPMPPHDPVNHPQHYTSHPSGIECIEITRHMNFNLGNAIKYLWRASLKGGVEDLKKAIWYISDEIKRLEK